MKKFVSFLCLLVFCMFLCSSCSFNTSTDGIGKLFPENDSDMTANLDSADKPAYDLVIKLPLQSEIAYLNGEKIFLDTPPAFVNEEEISMVPLKFISDVLGAKVEWYPETKEISILQKEGEIQLAIHSSIALVNGIEYALATPPIVIQERTFVPLKFVATHLQFMVEWIPETKTIILSK